MSPTAAEPHAVQALGLRKSYPGVRALQGVDFAVAPGEIRALLGKNGAGKSTLVKILSGAERPDAGTLHVGGRPVATFSPRHASTMGVATVHQELSLVPELDVAENILLGRWQRFQRAGCIDRRALRREAAEVLQEFGVDLDPAAKVRQLSIAQQQLVEIARGLSLRPRVLILDEPTSSLCASEVDLLLAAVRALAARGVAIVYVSHRMDEIQRLAHGVTVLRDGQHIGSLPIARAPTTEIVRLMTGAATVPGESAAAAPPAGVGRVALAVRALHTQDKLRGVSLQLREGEIVGLAGLLGAGRTELLRAIYGLDATTQGEVEVFGQRAAPRSPRAMLGLGVGLAPEDRKREGLVLGMGIAQNLVLSSLHKVAPRGFLSQRRQTRLAQEAVTRVSIKAASLETPARSLSGGNQQKVVLGQCLVAGVRVLLLDEPTRGVDIAAKEQIYALLRTLAAQGCAVLVASSEPEELLAVCDRLLLMRDGAIAAERPVAGAQLDDILALAMGGAH